MKICWCWIKEKLTQCWCYCKKTWDVDMIQKIVNLFKIATVADLSKHRIYTTRYEDLCQ